MNLAILIGRLTKDPESRISQSGTTMTTFTLAVDRKYTNKETGQRDADFIPTICWRQTAEYAARYLSKGRKVAVCGSIQTRSYDAQDGTKRYVTEVIADNVEALDSKPQDATQASTRFNPTGQTNPNNGEAMESGAKQMGFAYECDDSLPF